MAATRQARRATLRDVALRAGVSTSTASVAFSGGGPVAAGTRDRVLGAAAELGYAGPDPMARSLRRGRVGVVGAVVGERLLYAFRDPHAVVLLDGLSEEIGRLGSSLLLLTGRTEGGGPDPDQLAGVAMDAAVFATCGSEDDVGLLRLLERGVPVIGVEGPHRPDVPLVDIDDRGSSADLARHLAGLGHSRVAVVTLPLRLDGREGPVDGGRLGGTTFSDARRRLLGARDVLGPVPATEVPENSIEAGRRAGRALLTGADRPTAVMAQSDLLAVGVVQAAADLGLRVPDDVSVTGYDGIETPWLPEAELTTVVQPAQEKGRAAGRMVAEVLAGRRPDDVLLPVHLRIGSTTAPLPP